MPEPTTPAPLPLTPGQRGIWYAQVLDPQNPRFQIAQYTQIDGELDPGLLGTAVERVVTGTDALNMRFVEGADGPMQVPTARPARLRVTDLRGAGNDAEARARTLMDEDLARPRAVDGDALLHLEVFRVADDRHLFYQRVHHLMLDGYSAVLVLQRIADGYSALVGGAGVAAGVPTGEATTGNTAALAALVEHEAAYEGSDAQAADRDYWQDFLARTDGGHPLAGYPDGTAASIVRHAEALPADVVARLGRTGSAPAMLLASLALYLHKMTGERTVSIGLPVTARRGKIATSVPSMTSNVVPVAVEVRPGAVVREVVAEAGRALRSALVHQRYRLGTHDSGPRYLGPSLNILPVVDGLAFGASEASMGILSTGPIDDLSIMVHGLPRDATAPGDGDAATATLSLQGNADLYDGDALRAHAARLLRLVTAMVGDPDAQVSGIDALGDAEHRTLLDAGTAESRALPQGTVVEQFAASVADRVNAVAVVAQDGELTFTELDRASNRLAHYLRRFGAGPGSLVAVHLERSTDLAVSLLAVLKSGAAYVPVDPDYPPARVDAMLHAAEPAVTLTSAELAARPGEPLPGHTIAVDSPLVASVLATKPETAPAPSPGPDDLAYVIFTSGSTGTPKGVAVEHRSLANLFLAHSESLFEPASRRLGRALRVAHTAGISFDASWDPMLWLLAGHELHIVDNLTRRDPQALSAFIESTGIDAIETTPSFVHALIEHGLLGDPAPDVIALGGEAVDAELWSTLAAHPDVHAFNFYGPTETTVDSLTAPIHSADDPHLGTPVANTRQYVLDSGLSPVPPGAVGELYLAGTNVARGYLGRPELSSERFVADPYGQPGERMYRTGDVVRRSADRGVEFLGRSDDQIKIRGFRVELPEIEASLRAQPGVSGAAVIATKNKAGFDRLSAYATGHGIEGPGLRDALRTSLPDYMVPASIDVLDSIPLTVNGKLDKRALPAPTDHREGTGPRTDAERAVAAAFAEVLDLEEVGAEDDFFELGGHSLLATRLLAELTDRLGSAPSLREVFQHPTVAGLAARCETATPDVPALAPHPRPDRLPLSAGQARLWFINQLDPTDGSYNIPVVLRLHGRLDAAALGQAVNDVVARHEVLRTIYPQGNDAGSPTAGTGTTSGPAQRVLPADQARVDVPRVRATEATARSAITAASARGFDLTTDLPLRAALFGLDDCSHILLLSIHHIAADGWSMTPLAADLSRAYNARLAGNEPADAPLDVQYADYTLWQQELLGEAADPASALADQLAFWTAELDGAPAQLRLPGAVSADVATATGIDTVGQEPVHLDASTASLLRGLGREHRASLFMVLQAGFAALLDRMGAGDDLPIGTPVAGRTDPALERLVGFFVNTVVLRTRTGGNPSAADLIERVRDTNLRAYAHQDAPFDAVVEAIRPVRIEGTNPLFQVMLTLQTGSGPTITMDGLDVAAEPNPESGGSKFDLLLDLAEDAGADETGTGGALSGGLSFDPRRIDASIARGLARRFEQLMTAMAQAPDTALQDLPLFLDGEMDALEHQASGATITGGPRTLPQAFAATADAHPTATAASDPERTLDFAGLSAHVDALARGLAAAGVRPGDRVASILPRTVDVPALALAVLGTGAVLVPLDATYPAGRIASILKDSAPAVIVGTTDATGQDSATGAPASCRRLSIPELLDAGRGTDLPIHAVGPDDPAYIVYTSGSTGTPKGVMVQHGALANLFAHHSQTLFADTAPLGATVGHIAGLGFDAAWDPLLWMIAGAQLVMVPDAVRANAEELVELVAERGITVLETTPSYARQLLSMGLAAHAGGSPLGLALGGEQIPQELWDDLAEHPGLVAHNLYGPTEFAVDSITTRIRRGAVSIGRPAANIRARVLDPMLRPVPAGVVGELYLSGAGSAAGYVNRPRETSASFVADPWLDGARMYRTGDLVRGNADGTLAFVERADSQVKIRGFRIEPGEVERVLASCPGVTHAAVLADADRGRITAYVVGPGDRDTWRQHAARHLPSYMVPGFWVGLEDIPLTAHGKLDRAALPEPAAAPSAGRAPATETERQVCAAFTEVLGVDEVPLNGNFFELGGHSLLAVSLAAALRTACGIEMPLRTLFEAPTPAGILERMAPTGAPTGAASGARADARPDGHRPVQRPLEWLATAPERPERLPLSWAQRRMFFLNQLDPGNAEYNISLAVRLNGVLDHDALDAALGDVVQRHETLRTVYSEDGADPRQRVLDAVATGDILRRERTGSAGKLRGALARGARTGFDLRTDLPLRANLIETGTGEHVLHLVIHHIASDGASLQPLARDISTAYAARLGGSCPEWADLDLQYADYALWQRDAGQDGEDLAERLRGWADDLAGAPDELELPTDGRRAPEARQPAAQARFTLDAETTNELSRLAARHNASLFMALHAVLGGYLTRLGAGERIVIGSPTAGRPDPELEQIVGFFVNTLPITVDHSSRPGLDAAISLARAAVLDAFDRDTVPFERLVEAVNPPRELGRHPLFQTMLTYEAEPPASLVLPGLDVSVEDEDGSGSAKFDLSFTFSRRGDGSLAGTLEYNSSLFSRHAIVRMTGQLRRFADAAARRPGTALDELALLDATEESALQAATATPAPPEAGAVWRGILDDLDETIARHGGHTAVAAAGRRLTFADLDAAAGRIADALAAAGAGSGDVVSLLLPRDEHQPVAVVGTLRAGAAANPIDADYPDARIADILDDAVPAVVLTSRTMDGRARTALAGAGSAAALLFIEDLAAPNAGRQETVQAGTRGGSAAAFPQPAPGDLAYVLFTSGSTGRPKGVEVSHGALANLLRSHRTTLFPTSTPTEAEPRLRVAHTTGLGFDAAWDPFLWLVAGHELHVIGTDTRRDPQALADYLDREDIGAWETTPSHVRLLLSQPGFHHLLERSGTDGRPRLHLALGGEAFDADLWERLAAHDGVVAHNLYGPTEATVDALVARVHPDAAPHLGQPVAGTGAHVLDSRLRHVPPGATGELYLTGAGLARGYRGRTALTAERFVADPHGDAGTRMYRTGDLVTRQADGTITFRGRNDDQVKIRGQRVEPGEIARTLRAGDGVAQALVVADGAPPTQRLVAYVVAGDDGPADAGFVDTLRRGAASTLPAYMVPAVYVQVPGIPLTPHGKPDLRRLPEAPASASAGGRPPGTPLEAAVASIFADVLGTERVGVDESFFALGGHSFVAQELITRVNDALGSDLAVQTLFRAPTVEALVHEAGRGAGESVADSLRPLLPLRTSGNLDPLFAVHPASGVAWGYSAMLRHLDPQRPLYGLQLPGMAPDADGPLAAETLTGLVDGYIAEIRTVQAHGPYHLMGWSFGGNVVQRLATRLQELGEEVTLLAILDAYPSRQVENAGVADGGPGTLLANFLDAVGHPVPDDGTELTGERALEVLRENGNPLGAVPLASLEAMMANFERLAQLIREAPVVPFDGDLNFFTATHDVPENRPDAGDWEPYVTGSILDTKVPERHSRLLSDRALGHIMPILANLLTTRPEGHR